MDVLIGAIKEQTEPVAPPAPDTLVAFTDEGMEIALKTADVLRRQGVYIENSLTAADLETNIKYGKKRGYGGILYFKDRDTAVVIDLQAGTQKEVGVFDVLRSGFR
jgi:histidyl-tRNA synthetase